MHISELHRFVRLHTEVGSKESLNAVRLSDKSPTAPSKSAHIKETWRLLTYTDQDLVFLFLDHELLVLNLVLGDS